MSKEKSNKTKEEKRALIAKNIEKAQKVYRGLTVFKAIIGIIAVIGLCAFLIWAIPKIGEGLVEGLKRLPQYN